MRYLHGVLVEPLSEVDLFYSFILHTLLARYVVHGDITVV